MDNVFKELKLVRAQYEKHKAEYDELTTQALELSEEYISSMKWVSSSYGKNIYLYQDSDMSTKEICASLNLNQNSYRSMLSRISSFLRNKVFYSNNLFETILYSDSETKQALINRLRFKMMEYNFFSEVSVERTAQLLELSEKVSIQDDNISEDDLIRAMLFIKMQSNDFIQKQLKTIKTGALRRVISGLKTSQFNPFVENYLNIEVPELINNTNYIQRCCGAKCKPMLNEDS